MPRYDRQILLPEIGPVGQARLANARILLIGCGALGSVAAEYLVRAGIGFLRIVDRDLVELSNLQRQVLFDERDAAAEIPKAIAAQKRLTAINSQSRIESIVADVNAVNIDTFSDVDAIVDGTDNVATRYLINDLAVKRNLPWIYGACVGTEGRVWPIFPGKTACLRCLFPDPPKAAELPTCDTAGVLGPAAGVVGALQASAAIRFIVKAPADSALVALNIWTNDFRSIASAANPLPDCPCCADRNFPYLSTNGSDITTNLCGRRSVQVSRGPASGKIDLDAMAQRWQNIGEVARTPWFLRCKLTEPAGIDLTLFPDGRLIVHGTTDNARAASIYARFVGN
jgi:molybdopterin-synthase adenylyltransferase